MKILNVSVYQPAWSAASWRIANIAQILQTVGHEVRNVQYYRKSVMDSSATGCGSVRFLPVKTTALTVIADHLKALAKEDFDLVYANTHRACICSILGRIAGVPLVFDMHGDIVGETLMSRGVSRPRLTDIWSWSKGRIIDEASIRAASKIVCVSRSLMAHLVRRGITSENLVYVTNGVDLNFFRPSNEEEVLRAKREMGLEGKRVFGYLGGFQKWQGVDVLMEVAQLLRDNDCALLLVGGESSTRAGNVVLVRRMPRASMTSYYSMCDVLILPRASHPATVYAAPTKFAEYLSMGKPVLTTDVGDPGSYVRDHKCGIVVPSNSVDDMLAGISEFTHMPEDELVNMGKNARALAEKEFGWNVVGRRLLAALESAVR